MQDIKAFTQTLRLIFDYCSCSSGGRVSEMKELLPDITKALNLEKNKEWHRFCSEKDRTNVDSYTNVSIIDKIRQDGNVLAKLPEQYITWNNLKIALDASYPITLTNLRNNRAIYKLFTNERIAEYTKNRERLAIYTHDPNKSFDEMPKMLDPYYYGLWHKNGTSFEKLFNVHTLEEQIKLINPINILMFNNCRQINAQWNKLKALNIKGSFNVVLAKLVNYIVRFETINDPRNPWSDKKSVLLVDDMEENEFFLAYLKAAGKSRPKWDASIPYYTYLAKCLLLLQECLIMKYN